MTTPPNTDALREQLAAIEHARWADWQKYVHSVSEVTASSVNIPLGYASRWDRQIATPYSELSRTEQLSDLEQVDRYWPLIDAYIAQHDQARLTAILANEHKLHTKHGCVSVAAITAAFEAVV